HADVEYGNIGFALFDEAHGLLPVAGRGHDVEARFDEEPRQALPQQDAVLGQDQSHGNSALRRVPPPGGLSIRNRPPTAAVRSARPTRPNPPLRCAPPTPSSTTPTTMLPLTYSKLTRPNDARACLYMMVK